MNETTRRYLSPFKEIQAALKFTPDTAGRVSYSSRPWIKPRNPRAGVKERRWVSENANHLRQYAGTWVAVLGERVLVSGPTIRSVYDFVKAQGYADALVFKVQRETRPHFRVA